MENTIFYHLSRLPLVLAALVPAVFVLSALFVTRKAPFAAARRVTSMAISFASMAVLLHSIFFLVADWRGLKRVTSILRGLVRLELVSCAMLALVCTLAIIVVRYSERYLAGEGGLVRYVRSLLLTLAAVTLLVISNHLGLLVAAWLATGMGLHQLLTFYRKRRQAVIVAHKEFLLSRLADLCFLGTVVLAEAPVGSLDIDVINAYAASSKTLSPTLHLAMVLLVIGVLLKTAQIPFHGWILQVMEAPTPVSALLHAGVVNIGGFVMIRLGPIIARASIAQGLLLGVGLTTAILASLVMTTRASVKIMLAWSTIAQMGFMLVQCGLCVWHLALLHLLAHSLYKAYSFLSAGSVVETYRGAHIVKAPRLFRRHTFAALGLLSLVAAPIYVVFSMSPLHSSTGLGPLALALLLSFVPMMSRALASGRRTVKIVALSTLGAAALYFALHAVFEQVAPTMEGASPSFKWSIVTFGLVVLFVAQTVLQLNPTGRLARFLQPHLRSGLYIDDVFTRLTFKLWPPRVERSTTTARRSSVTLEAR